MKTEALTVGQLGYKCVLLCQRGEKSFRIGASGDRACHFDGKLVCKSHYGEKFACFLVERVEHCSGKERIDIRAAVGQRALLGECF